VAALMWIREAPASVWSSTRSWRHDMDALMMVILALAALVTLDLAATQLR
jgi:hypothetical protein